MWVKYSYIVEHVLFKGVIIALYDILSTFTFKLNKNFMRIKQLIKEKGITVAQVALRMGVTPPSLSRAINGNTTVEMLNRIAVALDVPVTDLFDVHAELYGLVQFNGKTYKIDSDQALQKFFTDYQAEKNILPLV